MPHHTRARRALSPVLATAAALLLIGAGCGDTQDNGSSNDCPSGQRRVDGVCEPIGGRDVARDPGNTPDAGEDLVIDLPTGCDAGDRLCSDSLTVAVCQADGTYLAEHCGTDQVCTDGVCVDAGLLCSPGANVGCEDEDSYRVCDQTGSAWEIVDCPAETPNCLGSGQCSAGTCLPGQTRCAFGETDGVEQCAEDGSGWELVETCGAGLTCDSGTCLSPCEQNAKLTSFLGCDYWAADLDNIADAAAQQFSVSVSNPNDDAVTVTILNGGTEAVTTETVDPQTVRAINLARLDVDGTGKTRNAFHITTNLPVTMHQFNPSNNVGVYSNDASLLLPTNSGGLRYVVMDWPTGPFDIADHASAYATIIAVDDSGPTSVSITPSVDVRAGGGVNAMIAGEVTTLSLSWGDVLNLETRLEDNRDLSGTSIEADRPVLVFAGHECAFVPDEGPTPYCDHVEQQLYPVEAWGTRYLGAKLSPRGTEIDVWRVVASEASTVLTTTPPVSGVNGRTLQPGEVLEFETAQSFELEATAPVLLGQFMTGSNYPGIPTTCWQQLTDFFGDPVSCTSNGQCTQPDFPTRCQGGFCEGGTGVGDPAFMLAVPLQQYRDNYIFLTPSDYRDDFITVIAPVGTEFTLDGAPISAALTGIGDTGYGLAYHNLSSTTPGSDPAQAHSITGTNPFALQVYGYDCDVSYAYPGGLNLESDEE